MSKNELIKRLWKMWKHLAEAGEIGMARGFSKTYDKLEAEVERHLRLGTGEQKLFVEMTINKEMKSFITARCPDEDDEMKIIIKDKYKSGIYLTLKEAKDFADFIISHVDNAEKSNGEN